MAITSSLDKVRLTIGDNDITSPLFQDDEIQYFLGVRADNVLLASADCCDAAAAKFSRAYNFGVDGQTFDRASVAKMFSDRAKSLRARATGIRTIAATKIDGYSWDIPADQLAASGTANANPRQTYVVIDGLDRIP